MVSVILGVLVILIVASAIAVVSFKIGKEHVIDAAKLDLPVVVYGKLWTIKAESKLLHTTW